MEAIDACLRHCHRMERSIAWDPFKKGGVPRGSAKPVLNNLFCARIFYIRDHLHLHVGFCQWTRDDGVSLWVCSARQRRAALGGEA